MARLSVSVASCTLQAGLKPPLGIFITRASASLLLTRGSLFPDLLSTPSMACLLRRFCLLLFQFRQLRDRLLQSLLFLPGRALARRPLPRRQRRRSFRILQLPPQFLDVPLGLRQQLLQTLLPPKTARTRTHSHPVRAKPGALFRNSYRLMSSLACSRFTYPSKAVLLASGAPTIESFSSFTALSKSPDRKSTR